MRSIDFANHLIPFAAVSAPRDLSAISNFLKRRQIKWIYHFTHFTNIESIFERGILSREAMKANQVIFEPSDRERADGLLGGISVSLSFPNAWMLKRKIETAGNDFVVIQISANALLNKRTIAFPSNASRHEFEQMVPANPENFVGARGLNNLFLNENVRQRNRLIPSYPTDVQSEIMVFDSIDTHSIRALHLPKNSSELMLATITKVASENPDVIVDSPCIHSFFEFANSSGYKPHDGRRWNPDWK